MFHRVSSSVGWFDSASLGVEWVQSVITWSRPVLLGNLA